MNVIVSVEDVYRETTMGPSLESLGILRGAIAPPPIISYALPAQDGDNGDLFTEGLILNLSRLYIGV